MADALTLLLTQFMSSNDKLVTDPSERLKWKRKKDVYLNRLINLLKKMMLAYQNEEVESLFKELEVVAKQIMRHNYTGEQMMDNMLHIIEAICNVRYGSNVQGEETVVGFDDEVETLLDQLTANSTKQLDIISIAGMAGLGKTTLARYLYNHPLIEYRFDVRAWTCVSQEYQKRYLLFGLLSSFVDDLTEDIYKMNDEKVGEKLYRLLKDRRYLVVLADVWDCKAWNDLRIYFPDDKSGSRVLFTSRELDISAHVQAARPAHVLRLRTPYESWDIFKKKVFRTGICPYEHKELAREIAKKCKGLPLAIVITSGLLKNERSFTRWDQIARSVRSHMVSDPSQYIDTVALSYNCLPLDLRKCFLFLGVFPEDYEIPTTKLIWLWVAQGFIHQTRNKILEDFAMDILMDLIKRSLLMIAKISANGQFKSCRIHDLLRDLCLRKAEEEHFSPYRYVHAPDLASSRSITEMPPNSLNPPTFHSHSQSGLCYPFELGKILQDGGSILSETYQALRILDVECIPISVFPCDVIKLANLRYLAIQANNGSPDASIV